MELFLIAYLSSVVATYIFIRLALWMAGTTTDSELRFLFFVMLIPFVNAVITLIGFCITFSEWIGKKPTGKKFVRFFFGATKKVKN